jgi:hypothetical protein
MRIFGALLILMSGTSLAVAAPVMVGYNTVVPETLEDFESYPPGFSGEPIPPDGNGTIILPPVGGSDPGGSGRFTGFSVETNFAWAPSVLDAPPCQDQCLGVTVSPLYSPIAGTPPPPVVMVFEDFLPGTKSFGTEVFGAAPFSIVVQGATASLVVTTFGSPGEWGSIGVFDPQGLVSVTFEGAEYFDDVVTSRMAPIPLPPAGALMLLPLVGLALLRGARAGPPQVKRES